MAERIYSDVVVKLADKLFAGITSFDFQQSVNMIPTTNMNTADRATTNKSGRISRTFQIEAIHNPGGTSPTMQDYWTLDALIDSGAEAEVMVADVTTPGKYLTFNGLINSLGFKTQDDGVVNISAAFTGTGTKTVIALT